MLVDSDTCDKDITSSNLPHSTFNQYIMAQNMAPLPTPLSSQAATEHGRISASLAGLEGDDLAAATARVTQLQGEIALEEASAVEAYDDVLLDRTPYNQFWDDELRENRRVLEDYPAMSIIRPPPFKEQKEREKAYNILAKVWRACGPYTCTTANHR